MPVRAEYDPLHQLKEYREAWKNAPESWKAQVKALGIEPDTDTEGSAQAIEEASEEDSYTPDVSAMDTIADQIIETLGTQHKEVITKAIDLHMVVVNKMLYLEQSKVMGTVATMLIHSEGKNLKASIHGLLHSVPAMAKAADIESMRHSSRICGVSPEWIRKSRDEWCSAFSIPIPLDGSKSESAKVKYRLAAKKNHWRKQKFKFKPTTKPCLAPKTNSPSASTTETPSQSAPSTTDA